MRDQVEEGPSGANRRQLVVIAYENQSTHGVPIHRLEQGPQELDVNHRTFVDDQRVGGDPAVSVVEPYAQLPVVPPCSCEGTVDRHPVNTDGSEPVSGFPCWGE